MGQLSSPCNSCPYRRDVPGGVWAAEEYEKLPAYDADETYEQPAKAFFCHHDNGNLCAGWVGCHDMHNSLGLRLALSYGIIDDETFAEALDYQSPVKLWGSGHEAAEHGLASIKEPSERAVAVSTRLMRKKEAHG